MDIDGKKLRVGFQDLTIEIKDADFRTDNLTDCYGHYLQRENKIQINNRNAFYENEALNNENNWIWVIHFMYGCIWIGIVIFLNC